MLRRPFANKWLNLAIAWESVLRGLILCMPVLEKVFGTFELPARDWLIIVAAALTVSPVLELAKWAERRGWLGEAR